MSSTMLEIKKDQEFKRNQCGGWNEYSIYVLKRSRSIHKLNESMKNFLKYVL